MLLVSTLASGACTGLPGELSITRSQIGTSLDWETPVVVIESHADGPTVMVIGGMHGNEPAGAMAARQIAGWSIARGCLIVVPRANVLALNANERRTPGEEDAFSDLNRQFPVDEAPRTDLARSLWSLVELHEPDLILDLHEGYDYHRINDDSVGSSVITDQSESSIALGRSVVGAIDATIGDETKRFSLLGPPVAGGLTRAANAHHEIAVMILETTKKGQAAAFRARQHRLMVHVVLSELDMATHGPDVMVGTTGDDGDIAVATYVSGGVSGSGPDRLEMLLDEPRGFDFRRVCATDIRSGVLDQFDVVVFPGGSGSGQAKQLRDEGRDAVRMFVGNGGGYVGICAGAYLASSGYDWSLGIVDAKVIDRAHWNRGKGAVALDWTGPGMRSASNGRESQSIRYANGPLYEPAGIEDLPDFETWAVYAGEINENDAPEGVMLGTPAVVFGRFGHGRVVGVSPHPEQTEGSEEIVQNLILRAADR